MAKIAVVGRGVRCQSNGPLIGLQGFVVEARSCISLAQQRQSLSIILIQSEGLLQSVDGSFVILQLAEH